MKLRPSILSALCLVFAVAIFTPALLPAAESQKPVTDLVKAYEVWSNQGIRFVVRDAEGNIVDHGIGKLESWGGQSKWVVRNARGHFLLHAYGKIENWKNGKTKLVLRAPKGYLLTHIPIDLTSKASFAQNVVGLRRLTNSKFLGFLQETLGELLVHDLKTNDTIKTKVLLDYLKKNLKTPGVANFKPVLRLVLRQLNFMAGQGNNPVAESLAAGARDLLDKI